MRAIKRYLAVDEYIFEYCDDFVQLPDVHDQTNEKAPKKRKISMLVSDGQSDSPVKRTFEVQDASTEEDTSDDGDNDEWLDEWDIASVWTWYVILLMNDPMNET